MGAIDSVSYVVGVCVLVFFSSYCVLWLGDGGCRGRREEKRRGRRGQGRQKNPPLSLILHPAPTKRGARATTPTPEPIPLTPPAHPKASVLGAGRAHKVVPQPPTLLLRPQHTRATTHQSNPPTANVTQLPRALSATPPGPGAARGGACARARRKGRESAHLAVPTTAHSLSREQQQGRLATPRGRDAAARVRRARARQAAPVLRRAV